MNDTKNGRSVLEAAMLDRTTVCELNDDFTLPDYMPQIGRVISVEGCAAPPSRYVGAGVAEFAGAVRYRLLYEGLGEGENTSGGGEKNGGTWCAELVSEYDAQMKPDTTDGTAGDGGEFRGDLSDVVTVAEAAAENVTARVTAPRRVTIRCRVRVHGRMLGQKEYDCTVRGSAPEEGIRRLDGTAKNGVTVGGTSEPITLHDTVTNDEMPAGGSGEIRVIGSRGEVFVSDVVNNAEGADCRGEICLSLLLCREGEGERPFRITRKIPITSTVAYDTAFPEGTQPVGVRAWGECTSVTAAVEENAVVCEASAVLCAEARGVREMNYIRDVYSCDVICEAARRKIKLSRPVACFNGNVTVSGGADLKELGGDGGMKLTDIRASVMPDPALTADGEGNVTVSGKIKCTVLLEDGTELEAKEFEIPYRYAAEVPELRSAVRAGELPVLSARVTAGQCRGRIDAGRISADCELSVAAAVMSESEVSAVSEISYGSARRGAGGEPRCPARLTVCYPASGETLWSVAKRYGADVRTIAEDNGIDSALAPDSAATLSGVDFLII